MLTENLLDPHNWVKAHADYLYAFTLSRINSHEQAKDLVQETFLAALQKVEKFEGRSSERTWLTAILKNKIIDVYRKKSSGLGNTIEKNAEEEQRDFFEEDNGHWTEIHQPMPFGIEDHDPLTGKEFNQILQKCMQKLPSLWMSVFTMKHIDDETTDLICNELRVSQANFWVIIHRTKLSLRACLQKNWI
ncbi:sigma-70 family RNA polymerase sigma factor [Mucilaginibacter sabulilitoris]|uniref:Sigma-70 family RNA polymerase sigma factor n=1 Tax=Mucilaginibacter sabulilitoris TaxID=1173583 RepID=A0ABZ0TM35_9SPHI|nr:sigma-70 family RNA polymerase sigma factor [Mucilaginibacter sabulilitoris]WPU94226.1 sigma-70 family RNA polymerase sigma factor [Mucilaginibacter sabulilitoris]